MFNYDDIKTVHIEATDKCNASCPQCARNQSGGKVNPYLPLTELSLVDIRKIFPVDFVQQLKSIYFCGNYGDPIMAREILPIFEYLRHVNNDLNLSMNTNGSARDEIFWGQLAQIINKKGNIKFGIDGLKDTHALYRKGTDFEKIIKNASAFINSGGIAIWEFIVFKHNEHQIAEARELASQLGFSKFVLKKTGRFFSNTKLETKDYQDVLDENNNPIYKIELPTQAEFQNPSLLREKNIVSNFGTLENYLDQTTISCKTLNEKSIYLSAEGLVLPCCWTANQMYLWYMPPESTPIWQLIKSSGGKENISAKNRNLKDIVNGDLFKKIQNSWTCSSIKNGKLQVCAKTCGEAFDQFKDQYK